jgi:hypothetical protein
MHQPYAAGGEVELEGSGAIRVRCDGREGSACKNPASSYLYQIAAGGVAEFEIGQILHCKYLRCRIRPISSFSLISLP